MHPLNGMCNELSPQHPAIQRCKTGCLKSPITLVSQGFSHHYLKLAKYLAFMIHVYMCKTVFERDLIKNILYIQLHGCGEAIR